MESKNSELFACLKPAQIEAINLIKLLIDCYNSVEGSGLFSGVSRYEVLADRIQITAAQSTDLFSFLSKLQQRMLWNVPTKAQSTLLLKSLNTNESLQVLRVLATETTSVVMVARSLYEPKKSKHKEYDDEEMNNYDSFDDEIGF